MEVNNRYLYSRIFTHCILILFIELFLIRWVSTELNLFAYLQNSILVICFLGLGMGLIHPKQNATVSKIIPPLAILIVILSLPITAAGLSHIAVILSNFHDFLIWTYEVAHMKVFSVETVCALATVFIIARIIWAIMATLGSILGARLESAPNALTAYSWDITGSLCGALLFGLLGYLALPPIYWVITLFGLIFLDSSARNSKSVIILALALSTTIFGRLSDSETRVYWTPYQKLMFQETATPTEWIVGTNNAGYQQIQNNSAEAMAANPELAALKGLNQYDIPSRLYPEAKQIVILGAGTGNDVAGVLRNTSSQITAVELDKKIVDLGKIYHPEHPYESPRLNLIVNDGRAAIQALPEKSVDLLILGLLDSHTTPNLSSARLDNFVYTKQSFERMHKILKDDGVFVLLFEPQRPYISSRIQNSLDAVFPQKTQVIRIEGSIAGWGGIMFVNGDQERIQSALDRNPDLKQFWNKYQIQNPPDKQIIPTTDSWPYLYVEKPAIPPLFWTLALGLIALWTLSSFELRGHLIGPNLARREDIHFASLGAGFSLVQTFSIYKESILFGATWVVTTVVVSGTLLMILAANYLVPKIPSISSRWIAAILACVCIASAIISPQIFLGLDLPLRLCVAAIISGLPILLSGILFARSFEKTNNRSAALGVNLFGALIGGILQYSTFWTGIPSIMFLATIFYIIAGTTLPSTLLHRGNNGH